MSWFWRGENHRGRKLGRFQGQADSPPLVFQRQCAASAGFGSLSYGAGGGRTRRRRRRTRDNCILHKETRPSIDDDGGKTSRQRIQTTTTTDDIIGGKFRPSLDRNIHTPPEDTLCLSSPLSAPSCSGRLFVFVEQARASRRENC